MPSPNTSGCGRSSGRAPVQHAEIACRIPGVGGSTYAHVAFGSEVVDLAVVVEGVWIFTP